MNFSSLLERKLIWAALCLIVNVANAQLRDPFTHLNLSSNTTGFFIPQSFNTVRMPDPYSDTTAIDASQCAALFMSMSRASLDSTHVLTDFSGFRERKDSVAHSAGCYSLALMDLRYDDFRSTALSDGSMYREEGQFYHAHGCSQSPCLEKESLVLWVDAPHIRSRVYRFVLNEACVLSNYDTPADSMQIDFDDGMGWRTLGPGIPCEVDYTDGNRNRTVRCRLFRQGRSVKYSGCVLKYNDEYDVCDESSMPYPVSPPWPSFSDNPWDVQVSSDGEWVRGRAYTLTSDDGVFDKPFVFVEGIDFGLDRDGHPIHDWQRHGTFGWCEFASGFQDPDVHDDIVYGYDDLHLMPQLLQAIRADGYDVVLVDFYDGANWLHNNSLLVQHVIRLCNEYKAGTEALVIAGASMGGVLTRHALRSMELNGEEHCTRLWISMDAPHEGAHIPLALQHAIRFCEQNGQEQAQLFKQRYLLRPAARQMLDAQVFNDPYEFYEWYNSLREMGYPQQCRSVAFSNGVSNGAGLSYGHDELMDWECDLAGVVHSKMLLLPESGDPYNEQSFPGGPVMAHFRLLLPFSESIGDEWYFWFGGLVLGSIDAVDIQEEFVHTSDGTINRDYAPGGKRNTVQTFALALNAAMADLESNLSDADICDEIAPTHYNPDHAFVLSGSAVGLQLEDPYSDVSDYLWQHPEENYFDEVWFAQNQNENHTELTQHKLDEVLDEVLTPNASALDTALTASSDNNGVFNFGRPEYSYLKSVHVHQQGRLHINAMLNTHFDGPSDYLSTQFHYEVNTLPCSQAHVVVDHGGVLSIGDATEEYRTGQLTIGRDCSLTIGNGGMLKVYPGSTLVVEEGGVLEVLTGGSLQAISGSIDIREGGVCRFAGVQGTHTYHTLVLSGNDARFILSGGELRIENQTTVMTDIVVESTGYLEVSDGTQSLLSMGMHAEFILRGQSADNLIARINNGASLRNGSGTHGTLAFMNGLVDLTYYGSIQMESEIRASNVHFYASDLWEAEGSEVWKWNGTPVFEECTFEHVDLHTYNSKLMLSDCDFIGPNAGLEAFDGAYAMVACNFDNARCISNELAALSAISDCVFTNDAVLFDWSDQELRVQRSVFSNGSGSAIEKTEGALSLKCCDFSSSGPVVIQQAGLDMSSLLFGGTNTFRNVSDCIQLIEASGLFLEEGGNDFSGCSHTVFEGIYDTTCVQNSCQFQLMATHNHWGYGNNNLSNAEGLIYPSPSMIRVYASGTSVCSGFESGSTCDLQLTDAEPIAPVECLQAGKQLVAQHQDLQSHWYELLNGSQPATESCTIRWFDATGRMVMQLQLNEGDFLRAEDYTTASGMYLLEIRSANDRFTLRRITE
jgi:hypothetical protein